MPKYENIVWDSGRDFDPHWGFIVYRTSYSKPEAWKKYIEYLSRAAVDALQLDEIEEFTESDSRKAISTFQIVTREDRASLEGLSLEEVREIFRTWVSTVSEVNRRSHPRYNYFILVDEDVLNRFEASLAPKANITHNKLGYVWSDNVLAIIVEAEVLVKRPSNGTMEYLEARQPEKSMIWQYLHPFSIPEMYDHLSEGKEAWYDFYVSPPGVHDPPY